MNCNLQAIANAAQTNCPPGAAGFVVGSKSYVGVLDGATPNGVGVGADTIVSVIGPATLAGQMVEVEATCAIVWDGDLNDGDALLLTLFKDGVALANKSVAVPTKNGFIPVDSGVTRFIGVPFHFVETPGVAPGATYAVTAEWTVGGGVKTYTWTDAAMCVTVLQPAV